MAKGTPAANEEGRPCPLWLTLLLPAALALCALPYHHGEADQLFWGTLAAAGVLLIWVLSLWRHPLRVSWSIKRAHWVQLLAHSAVYLSWGWADPFVAGQLPLIGIQLLFAYGLSLCLEWGEYRCWRFGLSPAPVVGSLNLFLAFRPEWWGLQLSMVAVAFLGKRFLRWAGTTQHRFNPSALALTLFSLGLLISDQSAALSWGQEIARGLELNHWNFVTIFAAGVVGP